MIPWIPSFKTLRKAWYECLESEGFCDAEEIIGNDLVLKETSYHKLHDTNAICLETKETYYRAMADCVRVANFRREVDQIILTKYAEGQRVMDISAAVGRCRNTVTYTIRKYEVAWGIRSHTQLNGIKVPA